MARKTYRASELVAGKTIFVSIVDIRTGEAIPSVFEHLVGSENDLLPDEGSILPFRLPPWFVRFRAPSVNLFKTRRAALRDARSQCHKFNSRRKVT
jgi:hypothetical protein